ncbi:ankyrin repeat domain-containing protein [Chryseobacterium daeguense]|uniref:ankyrin repeat domain-containing protein n=1 Tax=Chryseobacterium daeguense TaxID=412438 RepID=UPI0004804E37|nr:ankyrin repeat domain-containing protein [Chryseobacterium daeguense]
MKKLILLLSMFLGFAMISAQEKAKSIFDIARTGTVAEVKELMKQNPDIINQTNDNGFSPLILACYRGNVEVAKFLIDNVKDVNYKSQEGTALAGLSIRYNKDLAEYLLKKKADPNIADTTGTTPLIWAVKTGNEELVKLLLEYKANKEQADNMGVKPFEYAVQTKKNNIINLLKTN